MTSVDIPTMSPARGVSPDLPLALRAASPRIAVIGDHMLDGWWEGTSERISREAPAPVVDLQEKLFSPGGAANTAMNLASLGARVSAIGIIGDDEPGHRLRALLLEAGVDVSGLVPFPRVKTTTKTRILGGDQVLVRLDERQAGPFPATARELLMETVHVVGADSDAEVICDYASGLLDADLIAAMARRRTRPPVCVVDAHDAARWSPLRPTLVTPNAAEASAILGIPLSRAHDRPAVVAEHAAELLERTGAHAVVVTLDREGTVVLDRSGFAHRTWARPSTEKLASGAGDTFVATATLAMASGLPLTTSADLAQTAADIVVQRFGTSVCSTDDLVAALGSPRDEALTEDELMERLEQERAQGRRVVFMNGCFDVLTRGHTVSLRRAKRLGDVLVVAVNDDASVARLRGQQPVNPAADRANVLAALECVDYVTVFSTDTPVPLLERVRPDVYVKGGDYLTEPAQEAAVVRRHGGQVRILDYVPEREAL